MIALRGLSLEHGESHLDGVSLEVADGEIYFLLNRVDPGGDLLFRVLSGTGRSASGEVRYDGSVHSDGLAIFIDGVPEVADFETEARVGDWIDFLCSVGGLKRESIFRTLLLCNFHERYLKKKLRDIPPEIFKQVYLAASLAPDCRNIIINDFIRGAEKGFELKFNKLLLQKKGQGRAILCLGSDIFYASEIADRVGFIKNGRLLFEAGAADLKEMDIKDLYLKFLN
jgi:ABC-2 type transport system ATP-binding protein